MPRSRSWAGCTPRRKRSMRSRWRARSSSVTRSISSMRGRGRRSDAWAAELKRAIAQAAEHLSLYQLTIEPDTPFFGLHKAGKLVIPDDDTARDLYDLTQSTCADAGLAGLRSLQPRAAGRRMPAQSGLLARPRICRRRAGRPWPAQYRRPPLRDRDREAPGKLADARGSGRQRPDRRREAHRRAKPPTNSC